MDDATRIESWMRHSLALARARRDQPAHAGQGDAAQRAQLLREVKLREFILDGWRSEHLDGSARVWRDYMVAHARLQIRRYAGQMTHDAFLLACAALRRTRDAADAQVEHMLWTKRETA